jgi:hypothetical protein
MKNYSWAYVVAVRAIGQYALERGNMAEKKMQVGFVYNGKRINPGFDPETDAEAEFDSPKTRNAIRSAIMP